MPHCRCSQLIYFPLYLASMAGAKYRRHPDGCMITPKVSRWPCRDPEGIPLIALLSRHHLGDDIDISACSQR